MPETKVLLVGPCPPPHGGISVHVAALARELREDGADVRLLNLDRHAPARPDVLSFRRPYALPWLVRRQVREGFAVHVHTSGHSLKSWLVAGGAVLGALGSPCTVLTVHSGMVPAYLESAGPLPRAVIRAIGRSFARIVCVNAAIRDALVDLGLDGDRLTVRAAFLAPRPQATTLPPEIDAWMASRRPLLSTALFFRPEYGLDVLIDALARLRPRYPSIGCALMGSGDPEEARTLIRRRGLHGAVRLLGDLDHDACLAVMARSDVFVRPTRADGDSISVREALALGVRTVASHVGSRPSGVHLFAAGNVDGLVHAVERALEGPEPTPMFDVQPHLLELYAPHPGIPHA
jgi:glycosyltransferase involved in cell wall biosynthesis